MIVEDGQWKEETVKEDDEVIVKEVRTRTVVKESKSRKTRTTIKKSKSTTVEGR